MQLTIFNYFYICLFIGLNIYFFKKVLYLLSLKLIFKNFKDTHELNLKEIKEDIKNYFNKDVELRKYFIRSETNFIDTLFIKSTNGYSNKLIIYFHGNAGSINSVVHSGELKKLLSFNCSVLIFDYRGFGKSTGNSNENSIIYDSQVVYEFCLNYLSFRAENIMFYGNSLGCYIALSTINQLIALNLDLPKCIVIQNPFYSIYTIAFDLYGKFAKLIPFQMNNNNKIQNIRKFKNNFKIFVLHSIYDEFINIKHSEKLCLNNNLELFGINGSHNCPVLHNNTTVKICEYFIL